MSAQQDTNPVFVEFFEQAVPVPNKSKEAGRPIFKNVDMVRIRIPGDKYNVMVAPAKQPCARVGDQMNGFTWIDYTERFPAQWEAYQAGGEQTNVVGTPLSELTFLDEAQRATLRAINVFTAEQLAALEGAGLQAAGMGARALKDKAQDYLARAAGSAETSQLAEENEAMRTRLAVMEKQLAEMGATPPSAPETALAATLETAATPSGSSGVKIEDETVIGGDFNGFGKAELRLYIKEQTGSHVLGQPGVPKLLEQCNEIAAQIRAQANG